MSHGSVLFLYYQSLFYCIQSFPFENNLYTNICLGSRDSPLPGSITLPHVFKYSNCSKQTNKQKYQAIEQSRIVSSTHPLRAPLQYMGAFWEKKRKMERELRRKYKKIKKSCCRNKRWVFNLWWKSHWSIFLFYKQWTYWK